MHWTQMVGWLGAFLCLWAYHILSEKKVTGDSPLYQWMNLVSAICIGVGAWARGNWPTVGLDIAWGIIAIRALLRRNNP